jgi:biotin-dependent carboxylase-like uncharacterized protein
MDDHLRVEEPGLSTTLQDAGRFGYQRFGISPAGAMDRQLLAIANVLVGNAAAEAALETTLTGPMLTVEADICRIAVAGDQEMTVDGAVVPPFTAVDARRGARIRLLPARSGVRAYLAVAGGFAIPPVLESRSTHARTGIGGLDGRALRGADLLPLRDPRPAGPPLALEPPPPVARRQAVRVVPGPQAGHFTDAGWHTFLSTEWIVSPRSDRMGCQLEGPAIEHARGFNVVSDGIVEGSIQVPGSGRPIVLLADRQTTGGYTKIATVIAADLPVFAQLRPGDGIRFEAVDLATAVEARAGSVAGLARAIARIGPARRHGEAPDTHRLLAANLVGGMVSATEDPFT